MLLSVPFFLGAMYTLHMDSFEADATEGLNHMHDAGVVHCDHKLENVLICRSDDPTGFVAKVTDPGIWCGESTIGNEGRVSEDAKRPHIVY